MAKSLSQRQIEIRPGVYQVEFLPIELIAEEPTCYYIAAKREIEAIVYGLHELEKIPLQAMLIVPQLLIVVLPDKENYANSR